MKDLFSKCESHLLKKSLMENFIFWFSAIRAAKFANMFHKISDPIFLLMLA